MYVNRTESIKAFLRMYSRNHLFLMYNHNMECQVNVAQDGGERIEGDFHGKQWHGWTDNVQIWKSFRIPYKANSEPEYADKPLSFSLLEHAEGIGMTGWDWKDKVSRWVAFDFDAIVGHSNGLTHEQLQEVRTAASDIPWVTLQYSTSGKGLHIYVFLEPVPTANHLEHAALARSILGLMSAITNFDFASKVDICGGNMWVWHRKMQGTNGLEIIKQGEVLKEVPVNWRDHIKVVTGKRKKVLPNFADGSENQFEEICGQRSRVKLTDAHKELINYLDKSGASFWWDQDNYLLVAHTWDILQAHKALNLKGVFRTVATGKEHGTDHNCFLQPLRKGAWIVRRFTPGVSEDSSWEQDAQGWTRCFLNKESDLRTAAKVNNGLEDEGNKYIFRSGEDASKAALILGADIQLPPHYMHRGTVIKTHKDNRRIIVEFDKQAMDRPDELQGWLEVKGGKWRKIFNTNLATNTEIETDTYDDLIRHTVTTNGSDCGWLIKSDEKWHEEPITHLKLGLSSLGIKPTDISSIMGSNVFKPWTLVNFPFQNEYPGNRQWNRNAAQFKFVPSTQKDVLKYDTWLKVLNHVGAGLDSAINENPWAQANGLCSGADYLKCWIASIIQSPNQPLPYLFLYGPQDSGKSIFHEALSLLFTHGYQRADNSLTSSSGFNGELENAIICVVEETDLRKNKTAYNRIKDWVTSLLLPIRKLYFDTYMIENTTHWIQAANEKAACPVFSGDTRITMCFVDSLSEKEKIPKRDLIIELEKEAPDFLAELLRLELPRSNDRLNLPVIRTEDKNAAEKANQNLLEVFLDECCYYTPGESVTISEFFEKFQCWLEPNDRCEWSKIKVGRSMPDCYIKGRNTHAQWAFGNLSFEKKDVSPSTSKLVRRGEMLAQEIPGT